MTLLDEVYHWDASFKVSKAHAIPGSLSPPLVRGSVCKLSAIIAEPYQPARSPLCRGDHGL